ncbi:hypothetical protein FGO68_gene13617 [Halteria grandinella]|uniref:Uncharacterized protein n=1 Tax=Halteria grandinella TaxID=5974 RepID=A0A8J8NA54_HALGN|nr:hypothetical protein FGO68_gene13617 [Halteria grandinella]
MNQHPLWFLMSVQLGTLTRRQEQPSSPVLLTKNGPLGTRIEPPCLTQERPGFLPIQSLRIGRGQLTPEASNHSLYLIKLRCCPSYPEGNFGGNQLLDGSISLSPLYPSLTNDLHVSTATSLHQSFPWLHPTQAQFTIFRVLTDMLLLKPFSRGSWSVDAATLRLGIAHLHYACWFFHQHTRIYVRLLRRSLSPTQGCNTKQPDSLNTHSLGGGTTYGAGTLSGGPFEGTSAPPPFE